MDPLEKAYNVARTLVIQNNQRVNNIELKYLQSLLQKKIKRAAVMAEVVREMEEVEEGWKMKHMPFLKGMEVEKNFNEDVTDDGKKLKKTKNKKNYQPFKDDNEEDDEDEENDGHNEKARHQDGRQNESMEAEIKSFSQDNSSSKPPPLPSSHTSVFHTILLPPVDMRVLPW